MIKTVKSISKKFEVKDGKSYLYDEKGKLLAEFEGELQEVCHFLFLVKDGTLYDVIKNEDNGFTIRPYQGYSLI